MSTRIFNVIGVIESDGIQDQLLETNNKQTAITQAKNFHDSRNMALFFSDKANKPYDYFNVIEQVAIEEMPSVFSTKE